MCISLSPPHAHVVSLDARRGWREMRKGADPLAGVKDVRIAVFVDPDEDETLDIMVQRTGEQGAGRVLFVRITSITTHFYESHWYGHFLFDFSSYLIYSSFFPPCLGWMQF